MKIVHLSADWIRGHLRQLRWLTARERAARELDEELQHHLALETEQNIRRGMDPRLARRKAMVDFGGVQRFTEETRSVRWTRWASDVASDVRYALRSLVRAPAYAIATILTLAAGIGVNMALVSLVNGIVYRMPSGVPESDRLVRVENRANLRDFSHADLRDLTGASTGAMALAGYQSVAVGVRAGGEPRRVAAELVTGNYFEVLGLQPARGRWFAPEEDEVPARDAVAVVSHTFWQFQLGGIEIERAILHINGHPFRVIGVAPERFRGLDIESASEIWLPYMSQPWAMPRTYDVLGEREAPSVTAIGRLVDGVDIRHAESILAVAASQLPKAKRFAAVNPALSHLRGWIAPGFLAQVSALLAVAGTLTILVLLVCCANVAGLQLARALKRTRELAVRMALGASRTRVLRLLLTESVVLALVAGGVGTCLTWALATWFKLGMAIGPSNLRPFDAVDVTPTTVTIATTVVVSVGAGVLFGLVPALRVLRPGLTTAMHGAFSAGIAGSRMRTLLVGLQVTMSLVLLALAGMFLSRMDRIAGVAPEYDPARIAAFSVDLHANRYDSAERNRYFAELVQRLSSLPGVEAAAAPTFLPLGGGALLERVRPFGAQLDDQSNTHATSVIAVGVSQNWFETLEVRAQQGRTFREADMESDSRHVIISDALARQLWGTRDPVGQSITTGMETQVVDGDTVQVPTVAVVVGVVAAMPLSDLTEPMDMQLFVPVTRHPQFAEQGVMVRTSGAASAVLPSIRSVARQMDNRVPLINVRTLADDLDRQLGTQRVLTRLIGAFGGLATALALVGLAGLVAASVAARRREIGVRIALGARPMEVTLQFLRRALRVVLVGVAAGAALALVAGRFVSSVVWGVPPYHAVSLAGAALLLVCAAVVASWLAARGAATVNPIAVLREE